MTKTLCHDGVTAARTAGQVEDVQAAPQPTARQATPPPSPEPAREPEPGPEEDTRVQEVARLIHDLNADETIALATSDRYPAPVVVAAERATKARKTVLEALDQPDEEQ